MALEHQRAAPDTKRLSSRRDRGHASSRKATRVAHGIGAQRARMRRAPKRQRDGRPLLGQRASGQGGKFVYSYTVVDYPYDDGYYYTYYQVGSAMVE